MNYYCGLDIGSTFIKIVITSDTAICEQKIIRTATGFNEEITHIINDLCSKIGVPAEKIMATGVTGYGRNNYSKADFKVTEIKAIAKSINYIDPEARVILDIGGQDFKVVYLHSNGTVQDFFISDKCASGTGRFIELIAMRLNLTLDELSRIDLSDARNIGISSTCAVFADAEVIKLIAEGKKLSDIVYSIYVSIIRRILASFRKKSFHIALTGGVSGNQSFVSVLKRFVPEVFVYDSSDIAGAYGLALLAHESEIKKQL
ncbi:MAG: acyl-CoA dehydratase activase [Promethearchaeota archaeon]|jgi:predicted CoA-substrate-specific enzyme activase